LPNSFEKSPAHAGFFFRFFALKVNYVWFYLFRKMTAHPAVPLTDAIGKYISKIHHKYLELESL